METEKNKKGYIRVGHLVYIIIIAVIVLAFFLVFALGDRETASTTIGTASTVSSLILSVIAIVMTLIDVAGQRQSMLDLKETADKLQKSNESASVLTEKLMEKMIELQEMKEQMLEAVTESADWRKGLVEDIKGLKHKGDYKIEDLEGILEKANEIRMPKLSFRHRFDEINTEMTNDIKFHAKNLVKQRFNPGETIMYREFIILLQNELGTSLTAAIKIYKGLLQNNFIEAYPTPTGEDEILFTFSERLSKV